MADVFVAPADGYESVGAIRSFVDTVIDAHPEIDQLLRSSDRHRLVVIKPNWIQESHEHRPDVWEPVITHPSLILTVAEAIADRVEGQVTLAVCDAPHTYADFQGILARGDLRRRLTELAARYPHVEMEIIDLRREVWHRREEVVVARVPNPEDPRGYARLDLGRDSHFFLHAGEGRYYGADYDTAPVNQHHHGEVHEYLLAGTPVACDLFVNVPKLKTHKKTGITCSLKNLVGINGDKNWLPHHTEGSPDEGGDEFPATRAATRIEQVSKRLGRRLALSMPTAGTWLYRKARNLGKRVLGDSGSVVRNGNWHGNDTCWRMALDLNRALLYGNLDGTWREVGGAKHYLSIVDGIIGGQGNGPLEPDPADSRVLIAGADPARVDAVAARVMGFDPHSLPIVARAFDGGRWPISDRPLEAIVVRDERIGRDIAVAAVEPAVPGGFEPHFGWKRLLRREIRETA